MMFAQLNALLLQQEQGLTHRATKRQSRQLLATHNPWSMTHGPVKACPKVTTNLADHVCATIASHNQSN